MKVDGLVSKAEGEALAALAASGPSGLPIVEIGSYTGLSTSFLAEGATGQVYALDLWDMRLPTEAKRRNKHKYDIRFESTEAFEAFKARIREGGFEGLVTWVKGDSGEIAKVWHRPLGGLFIDGAHDKLSVDRDFKGFAQHIVPGGWLAFHDATPGSKVQHVIDQVVKKTGKWGEWHQVERLAICRRL